MSSVYLAGGISGLTYEQATAWREYCRSKFLPHITALSPMRGKEYLKREDVIDGAYDDSLLSHSRAINSRDFFDVTTSDMVLMNLLGAKRVSIGTMIEVGWAFASRKPIVLVMEPTGNVHDHPMVRECSAFPCATLDEAIHIVNAVLVRA